MAAALLLTTACGDEEDPDPFRDYFAAEPYGVQACNETDALLAGRRELRLFRAGNEDMLSVTRGLQRYYRRHGLSFFTRAHPTTVFLDYALDTDNVALEQALAEAFPGVDLSNEEKLMMMDPVLYDRVVTVALNFLFKPVTSFARANMSGPGVTNVILLRQIERPGGAKLLPPGASLAGLAVSPPLLQVFTSSGAEEGQIWDGIDLPPDFSPMVFLDGRVLNQLGRNAEVLRDLVVAHEFGHTSALIHTDVMNNLMFPNVAIGRNNCMDSLTAEQLTTMRASLGFSPVRQASVRAGDESAIAPALGSREARARRFPPPRLAAMLRGEEGAMRELLAPLLHTHH